MKQILLLLIAFSLFSTKSFSIEPTTVTLNESGQIDMIYFDLTNNSALHPLTGVYLSGEGKVKYLRLRIQGYSYLVDEFGIPENVIQGPFSVEWDYDDKLDKFKEGYTTLVRFSYDYNGRLEKVKDGSFNTLFALDYDYNGRLEKIDKGNFDYLVRFSYNYNGQLDGIKDNSYSYIWNLDYDYNDNLEKIKDKNYNKIVEINYVDDRIRNISKFNSSTNFITGFVSIDYLNGYFSTNQLYCNAQHGGSVVSFYQHSNFSGKQLSYSVSDYATVPNSWNDQISSITVPPGIHVVVYEHSNFQGQSITIHGNWTIVNSNDFWNDRISSFRISYE